MHTLALSASEIFKLHSKYEAMKADNERLASRALKFGLALSLALDIADKSENPADIRTCALLRKVICESPSHGAKLRVVGGSEAP